MAEDKVTVYRINASARISMGLGALGNVSSPAGSLVVAKNPDTSCLYCLGGAKSWWSRHAPDLSDRLIFTDTAAKDVHILRAGLADLFLDTDIYGAHSLSLIHI